MTRLLETRVVLATAAARHQDAAVARRFSQPGVRRGLTESYGKAATAQAKGAYAIGLARDTPFESVGARINDAALAVIRRIDILVDNAGIVFEGALVTAQVNLSSESSPFMTGSDLVIDAARHA